MAAAVVALVVPYVFVLWRHRTSWWSAGIATLYYLSVSLLVNAWVDAGTLTDAEAEPIFGAVGLPWLAVTTFVVVERVRARKRVRRIRAVLDAHPVPDTIPPWVTDSAPAAASAPRAQQSPPSQIRRLRYPSTCVRCHGRLPRGARAHYDKQRKAATCLVCASGADASKAPAHGVAGRSAREIAERRTRNGSVTAPRWAKGAAGEERVGHLLDELHEKGCYVLHDRRIPGSKANIDHLVVSPAGVWVVDAKNYSGRPHFDHDDGHGSATGFRVDGRSQHELFEGMHRQVAAVREAVGNTLTAPGVDVRALLCFVGPTSEMLVRPVAVGDVGVVWPGVLLRLLESTPGPLTDTEMRVLALRLENGLPDAVSSDGARGRRVAAARGQ